LFLTDLATVAMVFIPVWLIMPFKAQTERGIEVSYTLRRWSPLLTVAACVIVLVLVVALWRVSRRWWRKAALVVLLLIPALPTWFARQNHFEWMFNPLGAPSYATAGQSGFVTGEDMVLAVAKNSESVAYPVRQLAYHHVVQDVVGGVPIVATY
jgi:hypothetical protein